MAFWFHWFIEFFIYSSGGHYSSTHPGLGYTSLGSDLICTPADSTEGNPLPTFEEGEFGSDIVPVYDPTLPLGPFNSPVRESSPLTYGDVTGWCYSIFFFYKLQIHHKSWQL